MKYFHGSSKKHDLGNVITAKQKNSDFKFKYSNIEESILEILRPSNCISRLNCLFMADNPDIILELGGNVKFIYEVKPIDAVDASNLFWLSVAFNFEEEIRNECILKYWNGIDVSIDDIIYFSEPEEDESEELERVNELWEYRTKAFFIIEKIN
jgi:hypothetical protein